MTVRFTVVSRAGRVKFQKRKSLLTLGRASCWEGPGLPREQGLSEDKRGGPGALLPPLGGGISSRF